MLTRTRTLQEHTSISFRCSFTTKSEGGSGSRLFVTEDKQSCFIYCNVCAITAFFFYVTAPSTLTHLNLVASSTVRKIQCTLGCCYWLDGMLPFEKQIKPENAERSCQELIAFRRFEQRAQCFLKSRWQRLQKSIMQSPMPCTESALALPIDGTEMQPAAWNARCMLASAIYMLTV